MSGRRFCNGGPFSKHAFSDCNSRLDLEDASYATLNLVVSIPSLTAVVLKIVLFIGIRFHCCSFNYSICYLSFDIFIVCFELLWLLLEVFHQIFQPTKAPGSVVFEFAFAFFGNKICLITSAFILS